MKLLLTSAGLTNEVIKQTLRDMLGKPTDQATITVIPTAHNPEMGDKSWVLQEDFIEPHSIGWRQFNIVDLAAMHSLDKSLWWPQLEDTDVLLVSGGSVFYLSYWMQKAGLFDALPELLHTKVYVGISAGSQIIGSDLYADAEVMEKRGKFDDRDYDELGPIGQSSSKTLGLVDFTFRPHLNSAHFPKIRRPYLEEVAKTLKTPMYALDDDCAIRVIDDHREVVGRGDHVIFEHKGSNV